MSNNQQTNTQLQASTQQVCMRQVSTQRANDQQYGHLIYLIGMMGTGKTTVGRRLAETVSGTFIDLDELVVEQQGMSIPEIFSAHGEPFFRQLESQLLNDLAKQTAGHGHATVVATGGGIFERAENRQVMFDTGTVIWLSASPDEIANRLAGDTSRPLLHVANKGELHQRVAGILANRLKNYRLATIHIAVDEKQVDEIVDEIISRLNFF